MSACVKELNDLISTLDEKQVYIVLDFVHNLQKECIKDNEIKVKMKALDKMASIRQLGIADGLYNVPDDIDFCNDEIAEMFGV